MTPYDANCPHTVTPSRRRDGVWQLASSATIARKPIYNRIPVPIASTGKLLVSLADRHKVVRPAQVVVLVPFVCTPIHDLLVGCINFVLHAAPIRLGSRDLRVERLPLRPQLLWCRVIPCSETREKEKATGKQHVARRLATAVEHQQKRQGQDYIFQVSLRR